MERLVPEHPPKKSIKQIKKEAKKMSIRIPKILNKADMINDDPQAKAKSSSSSSSSTSPTPIQIKQKGPNNRTLKNKKTMQKIEKIKNKKTRTAKQAIPSSNQKVKTTIKLERVLFSIIIVIAILIFLFSPLFGVFMFFVIFYICVHFKNKLYP